MIDENDYIIKDKHKWYRSTCDVCGRDKGYQRSTKAISPCRKCAHKRIIKFANVDYNDYIHDVSDRGLKRYRTTCLICGCDKGYLLNNKAALRSCVTCRITKQKEQSKGVIHKKLYKSISCLLNGYLKRRDASKIGLSMTKILTYSIEELKKHLESQFQPGMTWDNYGRKSGMRCWEIDHKRPDSWFKYSSINDMDFKKCWALDNLQPMWAEDNNKKSNKYEG